MELIKCDNCGEKFYDFEMIEIGNDTLCPECAEAIQEEINRDYYSDEKTDKQLYGNDY